MLWIVAHAMSLNCYVFLLIGFNNQILDWWFWIIRLGSVWSRVRVWLLSHAKLVKARGFHQHGYVQAFIILQDFSLTAGTDVDLSHVSKMCVSVTWLLFGSDLRMCSIEATGFSIPDQYLLAFLCNLDSMMLSKHSNFRNAGWHMPRTTLWPAFATPVGCYFIKQVFACTP